MSLPIEEHIQSLSLDAKLELFEINISPITGTNGPSDRFFFHAGTNKLRQPVVWQGNTYQNAPIDVSGFDITTKGTLPKPKMVIGNVNDLVTALIESDQVGGDLTGAIVIRRQTYLRYLDAVNFPARVNALNNSEACELWTLSGATVTPELLVPDVRGNPIVRKLREDNTTANHQTSQQTSKNLVVGQPITFWSEVQAAERSEMRLSYYGTAGVTGSARFDVEAGLEKARTAVIDAGIQKIDDNGWYRVYITSTVVSNGTCGVRIQLWNGGLSYTGVTGNGIYVGRSQLHTGMHRSAEYQYIGSSFVQNPEADPSRFLPDETYFIERKVSEDPIAVEFELSSAMDFSGSKLPRRIITVGVCPWDQYRQDECTYAGPHYFDANDNPVTSIEQDVCSRRPSGCKIRHEAWLGTNPKPVLPFGGFPSARAYKY